MAKHAVIRTDLMAGTDVRSELVSIKYTTADIDNGNVLAVGDLADGEREIYTGAAPTAATSIDNIVIIASPEVMYETEKRNLTDFYNEKGSICRGYRLHKNDIFSVTAEAIDGTPAKGSIIELQAGVKLKAVTSLTQGSTKVGEVIAVETAGALTYYVVRVA
nr:MAG TPA: hypothetical protein [Caudoviricetes sp.]